MKVRLTAAMLAALFLSGCFEGSNSSCTSDCFSLNGIEKDDPAQVDARIKAMCADMGKTGTPEILERTKNTVAGHCT
jgi:hypothetical protein